MKMNDQKIREKIIKFLKKAEKKKLKKIKKIKKLQLELKHLNERLVFPSDIADHYGFDYGKTYDLVQQMIEEGKIIHKMKIDDIEEDFEKKWKMEV